MVDLSKTESESFRRYIEEAKPIIHELLEEHDFLPLRSIQLLLEQKGYWHTVTANAITELRKGEKLRTAKYPPRSINLPAWVYRYKLRLKDIKGKIDSEYKPLYQKFIDASLHMAKHCEDVIEKALSKAGFITVSRGSNTRYFRGRLFPRRKDIDFVAYKDQVFYGFEVKNQISYSNWNADIVDKKMVADFHGLQFVMVARRLGPYGYRLFRCGGLYNEFKKLIWSLNFSPLAERVKEKLYFPIICVDTPTNELVESLKELDKLHDMNFYGKGRM